MKTKIIFFGNGPLADYTLEVLAQHLEIVFHARTKEDLETVKDLKAKNPELKGVLASFGVMIKKDVLELFEPEGILNIHPSLLPKYRGSSPIETAILNSDKDFSVSIMKLVKAMDAGPVYYQETFTLPDNVSKDEVYHKLATAGAKWLSSHIDSLPAPTPQIGEPTFTEKFDKSMSKLKPEVKTAERLNNEIRAFLGFPKSRYEFFGIDCIILEAHISDSEESLSLKCKDGKFLSIDRLQPAGKKPMDVKSFLNGYKR